MWNPVVVILVLCLCSFTYAVPLGLKKNMAIAQEEEEPMLMLAADEETRPEIMISRLNLPSNATSIRADISDGFSCDNKTYGYYADVENECQIFHVCLPVTYADGKENTFRWSFICPEETVFSQDSFTCMRPEDMSIDCEESFKYYELNRNFGVVETEDSLTSAEEELNFAENVRQPPSVDLIEDNRQTLISSIVKKPIVKVQNSNRRKTQSNRVTIEAHRKKVQTLRKNPQPVVVPQTAKPVEEDAPVFVQEAERTTVKYQRFTKRPSTIVKEQPKPEPAKPEQQIVRQELFTQKRKRPQIYPATRLEAPVQIEVEPEAESSLKSGIVVLAEPEPEPVAQAEAQASEIAEVSIKPQEEEIAEPEPMEAEKTVLLTVNNEEPVLVQVPKDTAQVVLESEIAPMPENTPSRAEIIEIPIQKADEPLVVEEPAVVVPIPEGPMRIAELTEPLKIEEEIMANEEQLAEETVQSELSKAAEEVQEPELEKMAEDVAEEMQIQAEPVMPNEAEKVLLEPLNEPDQMLEGSEPEKLLETVKADYVPVEPEVPFPEPAKTLLEPEMPAESPIAEPDVPMEADVPASEPEMPAIIEAPASEDEQPIENGAPLRLEVAEPVPEPEVAMAEPEQPAEAEVPAKEETLLKSEIPIVESEKPTEDDVVEPEIPAADENPAPEMPLLVELPTYMAQVPEKSEDEPMPQPQTSVESEVQAEAQPEVPEESKAAEALVEPEVPEELKAAEAISEPEAPEEAKAAEVAPAPEETAMESEADKPAETEIAAEPMIALSQPMPVEDEQPEPQFEKMSEPQPEAELANALGQAEAQPEASAEEIQPQAPAEEAQPQASAEEESFPPSSETDDAQTLILDFISSLVNSESSNLEGMKVNMDELPSESAPEPAIAEPKLPEDAPVESQADQEQSKPLYMPLMQGMDQGFQIPVQIIESPEPEPIMSEPIVPPMADLPAAEQPQQPLSIDDVVELVKESLDTPAEKEKLVQEPEATRSESQSESEEVKPIYHRYIELGSNLLKSEALTASDEDEPTIVSVSNDESMAQEEENPAANADLMAQEEEKPMDNAVQIESAADLPRASEPQPEPEQLASEPEPAINTLPQSDGLPNDEPAVAEADRPSMSRSMNRFKMDPRKRRFLFRSDAS